MHVKCKECNFCCFGTEPSKSPTKVSQGVQPSVHPSIHPSIHASIAEHPAQAASLQVSQKEDNRSRHSDGKPAAPLGASNNPPVPPRKSGKNLVIEGPGSDGKTNADTTYTTYQCHYEDCQQTGNRDAVEDHEVECGYRRVPCPDGLCNEEVRFQDLENHIKMAHQDAVWESGNSDTLSRLWFINSQKHYVARTNNWILNLWKYNGKTFVARLRKMHGSWNSWITVLGGVREAARYACEIVTENPDGNADSALLYLGRVHAVDEREVDICNDGDCLVLTDEVVKNHTTMVRRVAMYQRGYDCRLGITYTVKGGEKKK